MSKSSEVSSGISVLDIPEFRQQDAVASNKNFIVCVIEQFQQHHRFASGDFFNRALFKWFQSVVELVGVCCTTLTILRRGGNVAMTSKISWRQSRY